MPEATGSKHPPLRYWTQDSSLLAQIIMAQRETNALLIKINSKPEAQSPKIQPVLVPESVYQRLLDKARDDERLRKHDTLVGKLLGSRAKKAEVE